MKMAFQTLSTLHGELIAEMHNGIFGENWRAKDFETLIAQPGRYGFIATSADLLLGYILCQGDEAECEIITLATHPDHRQKGVARQLVQKIQCVSKAIILEVATDNPGAHLFYEKMGFIEIAQRKNYYKRADGRRIDALILKYEGHP